MAARNLGNAASVALALPAHDAEHVRAVADGFRRGGYSFKRLQVEVRTTARAVAEVSILSDAARRQDAVAAARDRRDRRHPRQPGPRLGEHSPERPHARALRRGRAGAGQGAARDARPKVEVLGVEELAELGCGGILGVGLGSANPPRLVKLTWSRRERLARSVALVGKGVTYDSGGLTIKPGSSMATMKYDMGGAAAVIAATFAMAALGAPGRRHDLRPDGREHGLRHRDATR